jgi:hypothetical protein
LPRARGQTPGGDAAKSERAPGAGCPVQPKNGCIDCHMPKVQTPVAHTRFTDHFIRVRGKTVAASDKRTASPSKL